MTTPTRWWRCLGWIGLALACGGSAEAAEKWVRVEADGVTVYSEASQADATELLVDYLGYRHTLETLFGEPGRHLGPVHVLLYRNQKGLGTIAGDNPNAMLMTTAAMAGVDGDVVLALSENVERRKALRAIYEFDTIMSLQRMGYFLPLWMEQGTGAVMSTLDSGRDRCEVGSSISWMIDKLGNDSWLAWDEISAMRPTSYAYINPTTFANFSAQSWAMMRVILQQDPAKAGARFHALVEEVRRHPHADVAAANVLGIKPGEVTATLKRQLRACARIVVSFDPAAAAGHVRVDAAPEAELDVAIASLMLVNNNSGGADVLLQKAVELAPDSPVVLEAMARRQMFNHDRSRAAEYYRSAIEAGSTNPRAYLLSAQVRLDDVASNGSDQPGQGGAPVTDALAEIRHALQLNPGDGEAYVLLGRALFVSENLTADDLAELRPGFDSHEYGFGVRYGHALLQLRLDQYPEAVAAVRQLMQDTTVPDAKRRDFLRNFAGQNFGIVKARVEKQVHERDFDGARKLLAQRLDPVEWNNIAEPVGALRTWVEVSVALDALAQLETEGHPEELRKAQQAFVAKYPDQPAAQQIRAMLEAEAAMGK